MPAVFRPECLTLFLNNACNLACRYCHAAPSAHPDPPLSDQVVNSAATLVAASCAERDMPMTLVLHGGGEPLLDLDEAARVLAIARDSAREAGARLTTYVATNGVLPEATARWAAGEFDLIGLSCDGPPSVQDAQRPRRDGGPSSAHVVRTAGVMRESGARFHVRATVTHETLDRQREIVEYAIGTLGAAEVRLEPEYSGGAADGGLQSRDAQPFARGFLKARAYGESRSVPVTTSLLRPGETCGRHCNVLRAVVNLAPGDFATGCFLDSRYADAARRGVVVGSRRAGGEFALHDGLVASLADVCSRVPPECEGCKIVHACSHGCPDVCQLLGNGDRPLVTETFRCHAQRLLAEGQVPA